MKVLIARMEEDFVRARQNGSRALSVSTFHTWITLARFVAFSFGHSSLRAEHWEHVMRLEEQRLAQSVNSFNSH